MNPTLTLPFNLRPLSAPSFSSTRVHGPLEMYLPFDAMRTMELGKKGPVRGPGWGATLDRGPLGGRLDCGQGCGLAVPPGSARDLGKGYEPS